MRGYHSQMDKSEHYENGTINDSYHYTQLKEKHMYQEYPPGLSQFWIREWPLGWRGIDTGIGDLS